MHWVLWLPLSCAGATALDADTEGTSETGADDPQAPCGGWTRQLGTEGVDRATGVAVDPDGAIYVTGHAPDALTSEVEHIGYSDMYLAKYAPDGERRWARQFGAKQVDYATGVAAADDGTVVVVGHSGGDVAGATAQANDVVVVAFDDEGGELWSAQFGTPRNDYARDVATAPGAGGTYVTGYSAGGLGDAAPSDELGGWDGYLAHFDEQGESTWVVSLASSAADVASAVAVDSNGDVYVAGYTQGTLDGANAGGWDAFVRKLDATGAIAWTHQFGSDRDDMLHDVAVSEAGVFVVGGTHGGLEGPGALGHGDAFVTHLGFDGAPRWTRQLGTESVDLAYGVVTDSGGRILVTGRVASSLVDDVHRGGWDVFVAGLDSDGSIFGLTQLGSSDHDAGVSIAIDSEDRLYIVGDTLGDLDGKHGEEDAFVSRVCEPIDDAAQIEPADPEPGPAARDRYRIPTRVHMTTSELQEAELMEILTEVNRIWESQADICFEFEVVNHDERRDDGFDVRILRGTGPGNGQWPGDDHEIWVKDHVEIGDSLDPARHATARTFAHELGHGLGVFHSNGTSWGPDRGETVMMQFVSGWRLPVGSEIPYDQVERARENAVLMVEGEPTGTPCGDPQVDPDVFP
jgi:hypothetical protein